MERDIRPAPLQYLLLQIYTQYEANLQAITEAEDTITRIQEQVNLGVSGLDNIEKSLARNDDTDEAKKKVQIRSDIDEGLSTDSGDSPTVPLFISLLESHEDYSVRKYTKLSRKQYYLNLARR